MSDSFNHWEYGRIKPSLPFLRCPQSIRREQESWLMAQALDKGSTEALIGSKAPTTTKALTTLVLLEFLRWLCRSLVAPSWNVFGKAPSNMVNSGVFNSNSEISTICAA